MKVMLMVIVLFLQVSWCRAQSNGSFPSTIKVGKNTTTMLVFSTPIKDADRGSADIIIQPVKNARYVLKVKATKDNFRPTNLTVFTVDDKIFPVNVIYAAEPEELAYSFTGFPLGDPVSSGKVLNDAVIENNAAVIAGLVPINRRPNEKAYAMQMTLCGIYVKEGIIFFQFKIRNKSNIPYSMDFLRCYQRDKGRSKRSSQMEKEVIPRYFQQQPVIPPHSTGYYVVAMDQFTIANNKVFALECFEKNGDRHLSLKIKGKHILAARNLQ